MFESESLSLVSQGLRILEDGFKHLPKFDSQSNLTKAESVLKEVAVKLQNNFPYAHPLYAGQMLKPPHPIARLAYTLALSINPNNHAHDGGRASSAMEKEAVAQIAEMFGWDIHLGHLCSGGTLANLEALWVSGQLHPGKKILYSEQAHYTHKRISDLLKIPSQSVPTNHLGKMDTESLMAILKQGEVGTVVVTLGTTGTGSIDPLDEVIRLKEEYNFRVHVDAAYGGYYVLCDSLGTPAKRAFSQISKVDSIVIDPHKHGLQPYGCGCILFKDPSVGRFYKHDSPYTYFSSSELHLGEISVECSRPGASAVALWATQRLLPLVRHGEFASGLAKSREAALQFYGILKNDQRFLTVFQPELDIVVWATKKKSARDVSNFSQYLFKKTEELGLHLALITLPKSHLEKIWKDVHWDQDQVTLLRSCLMKPEHLSWLHQIIEILDQAICLYSEDSAV